MLLALVLGLSLHNPFRHHKPPPSLPALTMDSDVKVSTQMTAVEKYIIAYQAVRDTLPAFRKDEKLAEIEGVEIAAVQADLDRMAEIVDPLHDPRLPLLANELAADVTAMVNLDDGLLVRGYVSYHKHKRNKGWEKDLENLHYQLIYHYADQQNDPWYLESALANRRAVNDYENYLAGYDITAERVTNDIYEFRFDLKCIGSQTCSLRKQ